MKISNLKFSLILLSFFLCYFVISSVRAELISSWKLDGNAKDSTVKNNGILHGRPAAAPNRYNKTGKALSFNGKTDYVEFKNKRSLSFGNGEKDTPFSIEWWQKSNTYPRASLGGKPVEVLTKYGEYFIKWNNAFRVHLSDSRSPRNHIGKAGSVRIKKGEWTHIAVTYNGSGNSDGIKFYQNGVEVSSCRKEDSGSYKAMNNKNTPLTLGKITNYFDGCLDELKFYNHALTPDEVKAHYNDVRLMSQKKLNKLGKEINKLEKRLQNSNLADALKSKLNTEISSLQEKIQSIKKRKRMIPSSEIERINKDLTIPRLNAILTALENKNYKDKEYLSYSVSPMNGIKILPTSVSGKINDKVEIIAAPGEYESGSFVILPFSDITLKVEPTDLEGNGIKISSDNIDIKSVKCWYQGDGAWKCVECVDRNRKVLVPELLLKDDSLVKVDYKNNYLKLIYSQNPPRQKMKYVCISEPNEKVRSFLNKDFPVKDSRELMPVNIPAITNKQFWVTIKVPEDTIPGTYTGKIELSASGKKLHPLTLMIEVLPFKLATPKTCYDLNRDFICSLYYRGYLSPNGKATVSSQQKDERQLRAEFEDMLAHGVTNPNAYFNVVKNRPEKWDEKVWGWTNMDCFARYLAIRKETGMNSPVLFSGVRTSNPHTQADLNALKNRIKKIIAIAKRYGISEVYFYGLDEATGEKLKSQRPAWKIVHEAGGKIYVSGTVQNFPAIGDLQDLLVHDGSLSKEEAAKWHKAGKRIVSYSNPQVGVENPEVYRRNYGLHLWKMNYDGVMDYCYHTSYGSVWNDFDFRFRDHNFTYPTTDKPVDTIAFAGYREAIDDVKYATTLRLFIEKAKKSQNPETVKLALTAQKYLERLDTRRDLDTIRKEIIDYILKLQKKTGKI